MVGRVVVNTLRLLKNYIQQKQKRSQKQWLDLQRDLLCEPLEKYFDKFSAVQIHKTLLEQGLFFPDSNIGEELIILEELDAWGIVGDRYEQLKKSWNGAEVTVFIYPVEQRHRFIIEQLNGKMGISYPNLIVLFLSSNVKKEEIEAVFTHEYNHVCRLKNINKTIEQLTLLDSIIIEGLAEVAVAKAVGKNQLAPWTNLYTEKELLSYWSKIEKSLSVVGKRNHDAILFGNERAGYPKWYGYSLGYMIVKKYSEKCPTKAMKVLLKKDAEEILKDSSFIEG